MKRLVVIIVLSMMVTIIKSIATEEFSFILGTSKQKVNAGEIIEVTLKIKNEAGARYELYSMQDYICFDTDFFSFVEDSIEVYNEGNSNMFRATALKFGKEMYNRIYINRVSLNGITFEPEVEIMKFRLETKKDGEGRIYHDSIEMLRGLEKLTVRKEDVRVRIGDGEVTPTPTPTPTPTSPSIGVGSGGSGSGGSGGGGGGGGSVASANVVQEDTKNETAKESLPFEDVKKESWYYDAVRYVYDKGIMNGMSQTSFEPERVMSRGMLVTVLWRLEGEPDAEESGFEDLVDAWYKNAVNWASANGIVMGYDPLRFGPSDDVTREQMMTIFYRNVLRDGEAKVEEDGELEFVDRVEVSDWAEEGVKWGVRKGIIQGKDEGVLDPLGVAKRAEVATVIRNLLN